MTLIGNSALPLNQFAFQAMTLTGKSALPLKHFALEEGVF